MAQIRQQKPLFVRFAQILIKFKHIVSHMNVDIIIFKIGTLLRSVMFIVHEVKITHKKHLQNQKKAQSN